MADKRRRDKRINFWLTESEHSDIQKRADEYGMSISEFIRTLALYTDIHLDLKKVKSSKKEEVEIKNKVSLDVSNEEFSQIEARASKFELDTKSFLANLKYATVIKAQKKTAKQEALELIDSMLENFSNE